MADDGDVETEEAENIGRYWARLGRKRKTRIDQAASADLIRVTAVTPASTITPAKTPIMP